MLALIFFIVEFAFMVMNDFFYPIFPVVYGVFLIPIALACLVFVCYFANTKEPKTRRFLPEAILGTAIFSLLLAIWIFIYIALLDQHNTVYVKKNMSIFGEDILFAEAVKMDEPLVKPNK